MEYCRVKINQEDLKNIKGDIQIIAFKRTKDSDIEIQCKKFEPAGVICGFKKTSMTNVKTSYLK